jgi:hypothetical protein
MAKKAAKKRKKSKPAKAVRSPKTPAKATFSRTSATRCQCDEGDDGLFYCFKQMQGRWISCRGPFDTLQECQDTTNGRCA